MHEFIGPASAHGLSPDAGLPPHRGLESEGALAVSGLQREIHSGTELHLGAGALFQECAEFGFAKGGACQGTLDEILKVPKIF